MKKNAGHNSQWPYIPNHPYIILIIGGYGSRKTNTLLNLNQIQKYLYNIQVL